MIYTTPRAHAFAYEIKYTFSTYRHWALKIRANYAITFHMISINNSHFANNRRNLNTIFVGKTRTRKWYWYLPNPLDNLSSNRKYVQSANILNKHKSFIKYMQLDDTFSSIWTIVNYGSACVKNTVHKYKGKFITLKV